MSTVDEVRTILEGDDRLVAAIVFGSRATERSRPDSDLDVGLLPSDDLPDANRWRLQAEVSSRLAELVPTGCVDVVLLDEAPPLLRHQVLATGELAFCRDRRRWRDLRVATMREHGDREHYRRILREGLKKRLMASE